MPYTISAEESRRFNVSRALEILPDAPDAEKVWGVRTLAGQARMTLPAEFTSNPSDALSRLQEAYRTNSIEPLQTDDFKETETLLREGNWDELAKRGAANDSYFVQAGDALGADNDTDIELLDEKDRDTAKMLKARLRDIDTESRIADMSGRGVNSANGTDQKAAIDLYNKQVKERNQIGRELQPLVDEARKRAAAMRHVQRVRQKNAFTLLNSISGDLDDRTREIVDRAVANGYRLADGDEEAFALPEARGGLPESQKELAASFLLYCKPVEGKGAWDAFVKRMGDNAAQVVGNTASGVGDLFSGVFHGFDKDSYRDRVNRRAWVNRINARNFADLGTLGNSFAEAGGIIGYWTPQLIGGAVGRATRLLAGANRLGAVARVAGKAAGVTGFINRWGPEAMYFADYRQQFLERVALDGGDVTNPAFQVAATVGAAASAYVEHIQWGRAMGKVGLEEVQAQAYAKLSHRILAKLGIKVGTEFGSMTAGRAARLVLMERGLSAVTEGFEEAIQQAIEETVVQIGDGQGIRLADIADQSGEAFVSTLGPMMWTMMFGLPFRAKSSATMHNLDGDAIDRLMSASSRLKRLASAGKLDQGGDDIASLNELLFVTSRAPNADAGVRSLRERGFSQVQATDIWNTFETIRREAIQHGQMDALGRNVLPTGEELRRTGWEVTDNPDGTTTASRIVETADGRKRRQTINVRSEASQSVDIGDDSQAVSTLNTIRQEVAGRTAPSVSEDGTPGVIPLADKIAATYGFDLSLDNDAILADPAMREGLARYAVDQDLRVSGNTRLAETRKAKDADGNEIDEDVFDVPLTELATRQTIFHEVAHAVAATLRNMGLSEKEIDAIQNWRSGIDGKTPSEADMALPQVEGEAWDEERVGDELGDKLTEPDERGRVARAMNYIGDMTRRILGIRKEQQNLRDAVSVLEETVRRGYFGNIDELNDAQRRVLLAARQKRAEDRARREAEPPAPGPAEGAVIAPAPPPEETNPSEIPTGSENPNDSESETPPDEEPKSVLDRAIDAFCTNRPLQSDEMAALAASGEVTQDEIYETGYRWHYAANAWVISPEAVGQKFVPSRRYRGLDGKWHDTRRDGGRRFAVSHLYTGSAADYAERVPVLDKDGNVTGYRIDNGPSLHYVGTGESSQVYGWGLYASDQRGVAEGYAAQMVRSKHNRPSVKINGKEYVQGRYDETIEPWMQVFLNHAFSATAWMRGKDFRKKLLASARQSLKLAEKGAKSDPETFGEMVEANKKCIDFISDSKNKIEFHDNPTLYEQTFFTDRADGEETERHLLKWYEEVPRDTFDRIVSALKEEGRWGERDGGRDILGRPETIYGTLYGAMRHSGGEWTGGDVYELVRAQLGADENHGARGASEWLAAHGIDGVKYPVDSFGGKGVKDGDSAGWNYVTFRDDNIRVDHKWVDGEKRYEVSSRVTPAEDAAYMDAVRRGDMETAQRMVREAAARAMPNTKVVGENGLPKVVYHGTPKYGFTVFRENAVGSTNDPGAYGRGYYFTEIKDDAEGYKKPGIAAAFENYHNNVVGDNSAASNRTTTAGIYEVFLNIRNPKIIRSHEDAVAFRKEFRIFPEDNLTESEKEAIQKEVAKESERISEDDWAYDEEESRIEKERALKARIQNESLERLRQAYDGVIVIRDGMFKEIVAFQSAQIKSADPVTRDDAGNVIPLSQRFNPERDDIRFSVSSSRRPSPEFAMDGTIADALPAHLREDARAIIEERANTPAWMADPDGTPTDLNERDWLRREAERRHGASVTPHGVQKQAGVAYPDASSEIVRFSIGAKRREEYAGLLARKRPDLDAEAVLAELDKFDEPKKEKIALHWIVRGGLQLPEDAYKVDDALDVAAKAKVDPFAYKSPDELLLANKQFKPSARPIDPATVPELSDPRDEGDGIVSYLVQDDRDGQKAMRRIIDTHWGEDANPWCLLHGDGHGNLSDGSNGGYNAWKYWNHYSALPKRVAFKNGRLLAFMATEGKVQEHEYALPTRQQALEQAEEIREERQADHSNDDDATALQNDIEEFEKLSRELSGGLTTELADRLYDLFDQHNSGGVFSYVDSYAPTDTDISVPDGFMDRLYDYRFSDDGKDEDGNVILSNGDEDVMSEALEALAKAAQDVLDSHIEWLDNEYPVTIFERDSSVFVEQDGETIAEIEFQPPDDSRSDIPEEWWDRQDESHPDLDWAREGRAAVAGRVRAFDNEPQFSPRASLAAVATMELLAGKEPDRDALEQMRNRLGLKADVDEVIGEAKTMLDSTVGEIARRGASRNPGAVAVAIAESVQASHPEDLVREAFMAGANAQKWAQGTRGAALNALVRNARGDNYADLVMETGVDATGVLQSFPDMVRRRRAERQEPATAPAGERPDEATEAKPAPIGEPPSLADIGPIDPNSPEGRRIAAIQEGQEANIEKALRETEKEMEQRRLDDWLENADKRDKEAAKSAKDDVDEDGDGGDGDLDESDESGVSDAIRIPVEVLERNLVDVSDPETFTLWLRKIVRNRILKANGMSTDFPDLAAAQAAERDLWANPTNVAAFAKSMSAILRDMARRMLDHRSGAYTEVLRKAATLPHYDNVDAIEDEVAFEVRVMSGASISQTSTRLVNETRRKLKRDFIGATKPNEHPELQDDLVRKITGHVREMAKWYRNVLALTEGGVEKMRDTLEARLEERGRNLDEAGMTSATDRENDAVWDWTNWKLNVLDRFGGTRYLLPAEARERLAEIETWMAKEGMAWAQKMEAMTAQYEADRKTIIDGCRIVDREGRTVKHEKDTKFEGFWRYTVNTIDQRLRLLFARAGGDAGRAAKALRDRTSLRLAQGTTRYEREKQEMHRALVQTVRNVVGPRDVRAWIERMTQEIPEEQAIALSKQNNRHLTYGQVMHLYGYLRQTATYGENIAKFGREEQRDYIERNVLTAEDIKILDGIMQIYADNRRALDEASRDISGFPIKNPDPFYLPVKIKQKARSGLETTVSTVQAMPDVFSERRRHGLDVDEKADIMVMFYDRMEQTARVLGFGRTGLDIIHTFGSADVKEAITEARGAKFTTALIAHFTDWMNGGRPRLVTKEGDDAAVLNSLRTAFVYSALWGNTLSAFKQTLSAPVFSLAREAGERGVFRDMMGVFSDGWLQAKAELTQSDPWKVRYGDVGVMQETKEAVKGAGDGTIWQAILRAGMQPLQWGDATPAILCQVTAYKVERDRLIEEGMEPEEAKRLAADKAMQQVEWTQQSSRAENLPEYSRRGSSAMRMMMMFASSPMLQAGWEVQRFAEWREKREAFGADAKETKDAAAALWNAVVVNHVVMPVLFQTATAIFNLALGKEPPDEKDAIELAFNMLIGPFARLVFFGGMAKGVWNAAWSQGLYGRSDVVPSLLTNSEQNVKDVLVNIPVDLFRGDMDEALADIDKFLKRNVAPYRHVRQAVENWSE